VDVAECECGFVDDVEEELLPVFNEDMVSHFDAYNRKTGYERRSPVLDWELKIYNKLIKFNTNHYLYKSIADILNLEEEPTYDGNIGVWCYTSVQTIVRRVEKHLNIPCKERLHVAIASHEYIAFTLAIAQRLHIKYGFSYAEIAALLIEKRYPKQHMNDYSWTEKAIQRLLKKGILRVKYSRR